MKRLINKFWLILLLIPVDIFPQVSYSLYVGVGTYGMADLKEINRQQALNLPIETIKVDNFNPGFFPGISANTELSEYLSLGFYYQYYTTGSRIGQRDYSGYYAFDQIVNGHFISLAPEFLIEESDFISVSFVLQAGFIFSSMKIKETLSLSGQTQSDSETFAAGSFSVLPEVKACIPVYKMISGIASIGYFYDSGGKIHLKGNHKAVVHLNDSPVKSGWSGFRVSLGIRFDFN